MNISNPFLYDSSSIRLPFGSKITSQLNILSLLLDANIFNELFLSIKDRLCLSLRESSWIIKTSKFMLEFSLLKKLSNKLNFKKGLSSISVEMKIGGPIIKVFNKCIY